MSLPEQQDNKTDEKIYSNSQNIGQLHVVRWTILYFTDCSIGVKAIVEHCLLKITLKRQGHNSEYFLSLPWWKLLELGAVLLFIMKSQVG